MIKIWPPKFAITLNHFAYLQKCYLSDSDTRKIYLGADKYADAKSEIENEGNSSQYVIDLEESSVPKIDLMAAARQMLLLGKDIDAAASKNQKSLYSKLLQSTGSFRIPKKSKVTKKINEDTEPGSIVKSTLKKNPIHAN